MRVIEVFRLSYNRDLILYEGIRVTYVVWKDMDTRLEVGWKPGRPVERVITANGSHIRSSENKMFGLCAAGA